jgi:hypothetical protein
VMTDDLFPAFDATDERAENNANRHALRVQAQDMHALRLFLGGHKNNRAWFYRQLEKCHIYGSPFDPDRPDTNNTMFRIGQENIGKDLMLQAIDASPDLYMLMLKEHKEEELRLASVRKDEETKRQDDNEAMIRTQGFDVPPPVGWPGGPDKPPGPEDKL